MTLVTGLRIWIRASTKTLRLGLDDVLIVFGLVRWCWQMSTSKNADADTTDACNRLSGAPDLHGSGELARLKPSC
jgi:hypothetical protein